MLAIVLESHLLLKLAVREEQQLERQIALSQLLPKSQATAESLSIALINTSQLTTMSQANIRLLI
jgi:hypothetical protein